MKNIFSGDLNNNFGDHTSAKIELVNILDYYNLQNLVTEPNRTFKNF